MANISKANRIANPLLTRNGKTRLGPLNEAQLTKLLEAPSTRPRQRTKISNRIRYLRQKGYLQPKLDQIGTDEQV